MRLPDSTRQNLGWKLASLLIAIAIWASVHSTIDAGTDAGPSSLLPEDSRTFVLPITVMTDAANPIPFTVRPPTVNVTLRGTEAALRDLQAADIQAFVDLVDVREAIALRKSILLRVPPGLGILQYTPTEVIVDRTAKP